MSDQANKNPFTLDPAGSTPPPADPPAAGGQPPADSGQPDDAAAAGDAAAAAAFTPEELQGFAAELATSGTLSEATREAIVARMGISEEMLDIYLAGVKSRETEAQRQAEEASNRLAEAAGSDWDSVKQWAKGALTPEESEVFNKIMGSEDIAQKVFALKSLRARYESTLAVRPPSSRLSGSPSGGTGGLKPFASREEAQRALLDPLYDKDPAFRKKVADRIRISPGI